MRGLEELVQKVENSFSRAARGHEKAPAGMLPGLGMTDCANHAGCQDFSDSVDLSLGLSAGGRTSLGSSLGWSFGSSLDGGVFLGSSFGWSVGGGEYLSSSLRRDSRVRWSLAGCLTRLHPSRTLRSVGSAPGQ